MLLPNQYAHHGNCDKSVPRFEHVGELGVAGAVAFLPLLVVVVGEWLVVAVEQQLEVQLCYCFRLSYGQANKRINLA